MPAPETVRSLPPARERVEELRSLLDRFHRHAGLPFRLSIEREGDELTLHDSLDAASPRSRRRVRELDRGRRVILFLPAGEQGASRHAAGFLEDLFVHVLNREEENRLFSGELAEAYEQLTLLTSIGDTLGSVLELERAAHLILRELADVVGAAHAGLWQFVEADGELVLLASEGGEPSARRVVPGEEGSLIARVFRHQEPVLLESDAAASGASVFRERSREGGRLSVPITYRPPGEDPRPLGVLHVVGEPAAEPFEAGDLKMLSAIASQIGAAMETRRLVREAVQRERVAAELRLAHDLQLKLLPDPAGFADLADVGARCEPADSVGGDFYQLVRLPRDRLGVMLGDVSSHGISAALIMAQAMSAAAICAREEGAPGAVLRRIHRELRRELASADMLVTVFYGVYDPARSTLGYANAGHPHAYRIGTEETGRLAALNPPLGSGDAGSYGERELPWAPGSDHLLLFTDGLVEGQGTGGRGGASRRAEDRVTAAARAHLGGEMEGLLDAIFALSVGEGSRAADDRTALVVRF